MSVPAYLRHVVGFVEKSGGLDRVKQARKVIHGATAGRDCRKLLAGLAGKDDPAGANQLVAAALLGFTMAEVIYSSYEKDAN